MVRTPMVAAAVAVLSMASAAQADVIYDSLPPTGIHTNSQAYQAQQMSDFGDEISFAGSARLLTSVTVGLVNFAPQSAYPGVGDAAGYDLPMTLSIYNVGPGNTLGSLITTDPVTQHVPWGSSDGTTVDVTFNFTQGSVVLPNTVIFDLGFSTETYGPNPTGQDGPYDALNFGLNNKGGGAPSVGTDVNPSGVWLNTTNGSWGNHTPGQFSQDTIGYPDNFGEHDGCTGSAVECADPWTGRPPSIEFSAVPEPASMALLGTALLGFGGIGWRRRRKA